VVEGTQPQNGRTAITRLEKELKGLRKRVGEIDYELDRIALAHLTKVGPRSETPAELAQRVVAEREAFKWFSVRVSKGANDPEKGRLSATSPLGKAILGAEEGDEVELPLENGRQRKVLVETVEKAVPPAFVPADAGTAGARLRRSRETAKRRRRSGLP
jgi:transcription elongation GreA/GreB family factor